MSAAAAPPLPDPRYPIGPWSAPAPDAPLPEEALDEAILTLAELPGELRNAVDDLNSDQLSTPYREGGWTVAQVIHHVADSHSTAAFRLRKALTEDWPVVEGYNEKAFAELADIARAPVEWSLEQIESVHARWVLLLETLAPESFARGFRHAERGPMTLSTATLLYAWHSRHHLAHITHLRTARGW